MAMQYNAGQTVFYTNCLQSVLNGVDRVTSEISILWHLFGVVGRNNCIDNIAIAYLYSISSIEIRHRHCNPDQQT